MLQLATVIKKYLTFLRWFSEQSNQRIWLNWLRSLENQQKDVKKLYVRLFVI